MSLPIMLALLAADAAMPSPPADIVVIARPAAFASPVMPDRVLAAMRGGIRLDNGFNLAIGVDIQTRVDGLLLLHTVYASDGPTAGVRVYTDGATAPRVAPGTVVVDIPSGQGDASIVVDRSPTGTTVSVGAPGGITTVNLINADPGQWLNGNGQTPVPVGDDGTPVVQGPGSFSLLSNDGGSVVTLDTSMLRIQHLVGQATGIAVANTASDRTIDTISSINVDLQGISPALLAGLFTVDQLAFEAMSRR